ncbi:MAG TPA: PEGA domain-containing protein [Gemmatimonadales bacterium]|nr:PEGA domain-containing protein [Gemmatimonadales bacterium]
MSNTPAAGLTAPDDAVAKPTELDARRELGREFRIERLLGQQPILYLARDAEDRPLAVTVVPRVQLERPAEAVLEPIAAARRLDHPHIARIYGSGTTDTFVWYAAQYKEGRTLASLLRTVGSMELAACLRIFEQVASALDYAHRRGVSHGALTAECILVDSSESVLVGDFGAAGLLGGVATGDATPATDQRALALVVRQCLAGTGGGQRVGGPSTTLLLRVSEALRRATCARATDQFPSVLDFVAALDDRRGAEPDTRRARLSPTPGSVPGTPVVIPDWEDAAAARAVRWRNLSTGALVVVAVAATWMSIPPTPERAPSPPVQAARPDSVVAPIVPPRATPAPARSPPARASIPAPAPAPAPVRVPARTRAPAPAPPPVPKRRAEPGRLSVNAIPWGSVYVDGRPVGNTPQLDLPVSPGQHRLRVERQGYHPFERVVDVAPGQQLRITDITLTER